MVRLEIRPRAEQHDAEELLVRREIELWNGGVRMRDVAEEGKSEVATRRVAAEDYAARRDVKVLKDVLEEGGGLDELAREYGSRREIVRQHQNTGHQVLICRTRLWK